MNFRVEMQLEEAFGELNRYFCSRKHGREIEDKELLLRHFIESGGAEDFARRYDEAMSSSNCWYCSEFFGYNIHDSQMLWDYYMNHRQQSPVAASKTDRGW